MAWQLLNHPLTEISPQYSDNPPVRYEVISSLSSGASSNSGMLHLHNHSGTHVDAPQHFREDGLRIADFPEEFWCFERVCLLDLAKEVNELITAEELEPHRHGIEGCQLLLIRTGFERYRLASPERYRCDNPGFTPEAAHHLRRYRQLRAVGVDFISITPYQNRALGREAHRAFFDPQYDPEFVLLEDLHLRGIKIPTAVVVVPVFKVAIDASPAVVIGIS